MNRPNHTIIPICLMLFVLMASAVSGQEIESLSSPELNAPFSSGASSAWACPECLYPTQRRGFNSRWYTSVTVGTGSGSLTSSGLNSIYIPLDPGPDPDPAVTDDDIAARDERGANQGSNDFSGLNIGGAIGVSLPVRNGAYRFECEGMRRTDAVDGTASSFRYMAADALYNMRLKNRFSVMGNVWRDFPIADRWDLYIGGGAGFSGGNMSVSDGAFAGEGRVRAAAWQIGTGLNWQASDNVTVDFGYRYVDMGKFTTATLNPATIDADLNPNGDRGTYDADLTGHQLQMTLRFYSIGSLFGR